jgi:hypothetical protein
VVEYVATARSIFPAVFCELAIPFMGVGEWYTERRGLTKRAADVTLALAKLGFNPTIATPLTQTVRRLSCQRNYINVIVGSLVTVLGVRWRKTRRKVRKNIVSFVEGYSKKIAAF